MRHPLYFQLHIEGQPLQAFGKGLVVASLNPRLDRLVNAEGEVFPEPTGLVAALLGRKFLRRRLEDLAGPFGCRLAGVF